MNFGITNKLKKILEKHQFVRFLLVGVINTLFSYSIFTLLIFVGLDYRYAVLVSTIMGILFNFKTLGTLVFKRKNNNKLIFRFISVYTVIYLLNVEALRIADSVNVNIDQKVKIIFAGAILVIPSSIISYVLNKFFVFRG
jgi:putative flippase GtrA